MQICEVVATNLTGSMLVAREAVRRMRSQPQGGAIFMVEGDGSRGNPTPRNIPYGSTKFAIVHLSKYVPQSC